MEIVKKQDLNLIDKKISDGDYSGSFAKIYKCLVNGHYYAYKEFHYHTHFKIIEEKMCDLSNVSLKKSILPEYLVYDEKKYENVSYLSRWKNYYDLADLVSLELIEDTSQKLIALKNIRNSIIELHDNNIIHGDIHMGNILVSEKTFDSKIIDFDACNYKNYELDMKHILEFSKLYVKKYGINKQLDINLFNRLALELIYSIYYNHNINKFQKKIFSMYDEFSWDKKTKHIIDTILFNAEKPSNDFLIDTPLIKRLKP